MIEISFGHKIINGIIYINKLSIGHGLKKYGQTYFLSLIEEEKDIGSGFVAYATRKWSFPFMGYYNFKNKIKKYFSNNNSNVDFKCQNPKDCGVSTGFHNGLTFGSGELDYYGYWEKPCYYHAREHERNNPDSGECWPFKKENKENIK